MMKFSPALLIGILLICIGALPGNAQSGSTSGTIHGTVVDPTGAVINGAIVTVQNPVSGLSLTSTTNSQGVFTFGNLPFSHYHLTISASGFNTAEQDADVRSAVPLQLKTNMVLGSAATTVTVTETSQDLIDTGSTTETNVDRSLFDKLPLESQSSSLSSLVTLSSPGVAADSNGLFHGPGDHASNSFSIDGQPITDQQSKVFSNSLRARSSSTAWRHRGLLRNFRHHQ